MSQATVWNVPLAGPGTMSQFAGRAGPSLDAILTLHSGAGRPAYAVANTPWLKIVSGTVWELYLFDGTVDILIGTIPRLRENPKTPLAKRRDPDSTERVIRPGFLDIESRQNLIELARDGSAAP